MAKTQKRKRCPNGTRRNPVTQNCDPIKKPSPPKVVSEPIPEKMIIKRKKCPEGTKRSSETGKCEPIVTKKNTKKRKRCPNGTKRDLKTGECVPIKKKDAPTLPIKKKEASKYYAPPIPKNKKCIFYEYPNCLKVPKYQEIRVDWKKKENLDIYYCENHKDMSCQIIPKSEAPGYPKGVADCLGPQGQTYFLKVI